MKILIIKIGAIGDAILALSLLDAIHDCHSNASVTWVCGSSIEPLLHAYGKIQEVMVVDDRKLLRGSLLGKAFVILRLWSRIACRRFDLVLTAHPDPRYRWLSFLTFAGTKRSFGREGPRMEPVPGRFHGDEYVRLVTGIDGPQATKSRFPRLSLELPDRLKSLIRATGPLIALAPGGAKNILRDDSLRRWPVQNYAALCQALLQSGTTVVLTGAPSDEWVRASFAGMKIIDLVGKTSLLELIALYGACQLVITHDSGPMHMATLAAVPVLALFGPTNPIEKVPSEMPVRVLWGGCNLACRPCYDGKEYANCRDNACMKDITVEAVHQAACHMLKLKC